MYHNLTLVLINMQVIFNFLPLPRTLLNKCFQNILVNMPLRACVSISMEQTRKLQQLSQRTWAYYTLTNYYKLPSRSSPKILPAMEKLPLLQTLPTLDINYPFNFCQYKAPKNLIVICISLNTSDMKHLFIGLLAYLICSFLEQPVYIFFSCCTFVFFFFLTDV